MGYENNHDYLEFKNPKNRKWMLVKPCLKDFSAQSKNSCVTNSLRGTKEKVEHCKTNATLISMTEQIN